MNGTESEGFEPERELDLGDVHEYREIRNVKDAHLVIARCRCGWRMGGFGKRDVAERLWQEHASQPAAGAPSQAVVLASLPAKWRAEAAEVWNGDGAFPAGYIDGIQRRRTAGTLLACAEQLESAIAGLGDAP
jgi:hypothetical protein